MEIETHRDSEEVDINFEAAPSNKALFLEKVQQSNLACQNGDFPNAIRLYTEAIVLDPGNHVLYSNRAAAYIKVGKYSRALQDAIKARELHAKWPKAYYRQGVALQCLGRHADALAAFASGLAQDSKNYHLLAGLVEAAMKSPLRASLEPTYRQLQAMHLDKSPFVITSVVGQELLASGSHAAAVVVLESALHIGTCSLKLRGSVFSALSSAYWALNSLDKAIAYMQQDLAVAKSLGDQAGECRAHGNLGSAYFSKGNYKEALTSHRYQLVLAMKCKDTYAAATALTSLGHVYTAVGDYPNALASHKQCVQLVRQVGDKLQESREIGNVGTVYLAMGDFDQAVQCHLEHLRLAEQLGNKVEEARAYSNLGSSHHYRRNFEQAITYHNHVLKISHDLLDKTLEARAYAGLGHAARCMGDYGQAKKWHEKQLDMALSTKDKVSEGRACSNLGIVYQLLGDFDAAHKLHQAHLNITRSLGDKAGMGRAYGNIGNAFSAMGRYEDAVKFHKQELTISKDVNDRSAEASTHGNLAVAYQALKMHDMAILHYHSHLNIAQELKDTAGEICALSNLGNCHSSRGEFAQAVPYYESYLRLSQEISDIEGEAKACHFLGYAHYCLGNYKDAIHYYERDLDLAKDLQDKLSMGRAYCNLGLSHLALGNFHSALECQKFFLAVAQMMKHIQGKFRALGNIGDVLMKMGSHHEAVRPYQKQLVLAKQTQDKALEAAAFGALGLCHKQMQCYDKALGFHTQELTLCQELCDTRGECKAHGHLGAVHMALGNYTHAMKCYEEQLERAKELHDCALETQALGNLGISRMNIGHYEDAIGYFEQQLALLEQLGNESAFVDKGRGYGNLGECYDALGDFEEAIKCHKQYLAVALKGNHLKDQERSYRGLGNSYKFFGNLQQALVCFEKRLVVAHELDNISAKAAAYGELGSIHCQLGNFEQAVSCLDHQLALAKEMCDCSIEADATCGLGSVYQQMGDYQRALRYHQIDLDIALATNNLAAQGRAYGNLGVAYESLGNFEQAINYQEKHLTIAAEINDKIAKILAYSSLGRVHHAIGDTTQAVSFLQEGLLIAEQLNRREDEARIRHRLGLALWGNKDLEGAQQQLYRAIDLFESIRRENRGSSDYKLSLFDLQTASFQALQRVLVCLDRPHEALVVAERGRTRAFIDLLLEQQALTIHGVLNFNPSSPEQIADVVSKQKATVIYYSIAAGYLYTWLIVPNKGIVQFFEKSINELDSDSIDEPNGALPTSNSLLERYIVRVHEALGLDAHLSGISDETESESGDMWNNQMDEDHLNQEYEQPGFLRMVNRNHLFNSSNYSLSSLFSVGSIGGSIKSGVASRPGSIRSHRNQWQGPAPLHALYDLLISPIEEKLPKDPENNEILLVLDGDLYLVPFAVLKNSTCDEYLCERFCLTVLPSISSLKAGQKSRSLHKSNNNKDHINAVVVGNPKIPSGISEQFGFNDLPQAEQEANLVADILGTKAIKGCAATKESILSQISEADCIHIASHISWKHSAIILSPSEFVEPSHHIPEVHRDNAEYCQDDHVSDIVTHLPPHSEFLLTASDILNLRLTAKLVVISSCYTRNHHGHAYSDGVVCLTRSFLAAGAQCVILSLWPVAEAAVQILFRTFYSALLQGSKVSFALADAMRTIQNTKQFAHPANWASFILIGANIHLNNQVMMFGQALRELLKSPNTCRDALRVVLHLVEKSLQRIHRGHKNAMYTTQKSIENKVGSACGWKEILISVGFRFEPASNGLPASVFFPQNDPGERLTQCSASLQAVLGLSSVSLDSITKLLSSPEYAEDIIQLMQQVKAQFILKEQEIDAIKCSVSVKLWSIPGCHELLASLGFDLMEVGRDEVTLLMGKQANKRTIQFALQALLAIFETHEAPKSLVLEDSSSVESLDSVNSDSQTVSPLPAATTTLTYPTWRSAFRNQTLARSTNGAFSTYARTRGEPDGRTGNEKEREIDTFTPSPVDTILKVYSMGHARKMSPQTSPHVAVSLSHQNKIRCMYSNDSPVSESSNLRPSSSSSASSAADWDSGLLTVRRQILSRNKDTGIFRKKENSAKNFSVFNSSKRNLRTNESPCNFAYKKDLCLSTRKDASDSYSKISSDFNKCEIFHDSDKIPIQSPHPGRVRPVEMEESNFQSGLYVPCLEGQSQNNIDSMEIGIPPSICHTSNKIMLSHGVKRKVGKQETSGSYSLNTQLRHLSEETPISDVYNDRNMGLGLAPSLSKMLAAGSIHDLADDNDESKNRFATSTVKMKRHVPMRSFQPLQLTDALRHPPRADPRENQPQLMATGNNNFDSASDSYNTLVRDSGDGVSFSDMSCIVSKDRLSKIQRDRELLIENENPESYETSSVCFSDCKSESGKSRNFNKNCDFEEDSKAFPSSLNFKETWSTSSSKNCFTNSTSDTEGSDLDCASGNVSTVKRNPKHTSTVTAEK